MKKPIALLAATWFFAGQVSADIDIHSGNYWHSICKDNPNGECLIFVMGLVEGMNGASFFVSKEQSFAFCFDESISYSQLRDVFIKKLERDPEHRNYPVAMIAYTAWLEAWPPCPAKKKNK